MNAPANNNIESLSRAIQDAYRLREEIFQNVADHNLKKARPRPYKFNYLVDTQIVALYAQPRDWANNLSALPSLSGIDVEANIDDAPAHLPSENGNADERAILEANALITGEFIFSEALVGPGKRILIAPEHVPELMNYLAAFDRRIRASAHAQEGADDPYADLRHALNGLQRLIVSDGLPIEQVMNRMRDQLVTGLAGISHSDLLAPYRLNKLFDKNLLGNAAGHASFTREIISPPASTLRWWIGAINEARKNRPQPQRPRALEADAVTLAQLSALNQDWRESREVFVLISDDLGLHAAYLQWMRWEHSFNRGHFYPLRSSRQYVPMLNINEMGGAFHERLTFDELTRSINTLIETFSSNETQDGAWPGLRYRAPTKSQIQRNLIGQFGHLGEDAGGTLRRFGQSFSAIANTWTDALNYAATVKSDVVKGLITDELSYWRRLLSGAEIHGAFRTEVKNLTRGFDQLAAASILLRSELRALEASRDKETNTAIDLHGRRDIPSAFSDFSSNIFCSFSIQQNSARVAHKGTSGIDDLIGAHRDERLLVMGALCIDIGAWAAAESLLQQSEAALNQPRADRPVGLVDEIKFVRCLSRRLAADLWNWASEYRDVEIQLKKLREEAVDDFGRLRLEGELLALYLCAVAWEPFRSKRAARWLKLSEASWRRMIRLLPEIRGQSVDPEAMRCVSNQFELNTMVLAFWRHALFDEVSGMLAGFARQILRSYAEQVNLDAMQSQHRSIYPMLAKYALYPLDRPRLAQDIAVGISNILAMDQQGGFAFDIPAVDREEYMKVKNFVETF